jgi:hypothetical protein
MMLLNLMMKALLPLQMKTGKKGVHVQNSEAQYLSNDSILDEGLEIVIHCMALLL